MNYLPKRKPKVRMNCQPPKVVECRAHWTWIRKQEFCCLAFSRVSKVTGLVHTCEGPLDPHHARTRGAGGKRRAIARARSAACVKVNSAWTLRSCRRARWPSC